MRWFIIHSHHITDKIEAKDIRTAEKRFKELWPDAEIVHSYILKYPQISLKSK